MSRYNLKTLASAGSLAVLLLANAHAQTSLPSANYGASTTGLGPINLKAEQSNYLLSFSPNTETIPRGAPTGAVGIWNQAGVQFTPGAATNSTIQVDSSSLFSRRMVDIQSDSTPSVIVGTDGSSIQSAKFESGWVMTFQKSPDLLTNPDIDYSTVFPAIEDVTLDIHNVRVDFQTKTLIADISQSSVTTSNGAQVSSSASYSNIPIWQADTITGVEKLSSQEIDGFLTGQITGTSASGLTLNARNAVTHQEFVRNELQIVSYSYGTGYVYALVPVYNTVTDSISATFSADTSFSGMRLTNEGAALFNVLFADVYASSGVEMPAIISNFNSGTTDWGSFTTKLSFVASVPEPNQVFTFGLGLLFVFAAYRQALQKHARAS